MSVAIEQRQFETHIVTDPTSQSSIEVVPERGGIVTSWCVNDREILYLDAERFRDRSLSIRGGIPILFPICGNLPENIFHYKGKEYLLKQHGFARDLPWQVVPTPSDIAPGDGATISLRLTSNDITRTGYPFDFEIIYTYQIHGNTLAIQQRFTNHSDQTMPFASGLHPYFAVDHKQNLEFAIPANQYWDHVGETTQTYTGGFDFAVDEIDVAFTELFTPMAEVKDGDRNLILRLEYDPNYSALVFWSVKGKDYYCLEPWTAPRNALNTGENMIVLEPGASRDLMVQMSVSFG